MSKAKRTTCMLAFLAIGVAGALLVVLWPSILSDWYLWRLDHEDRAVRDEAAEALGRLGQGKSVPRILESIATERISEDAAVRALVAFGRAIVPALLEALSDSRRALRPAAIESLLRVEPDQHAAEAMLLRGLCIRDQDQQSIWALARLREPSRAAVLALAGMAGDPKYTYPHFAADALGQIGPGAAEGIPALLAVLAVGGQERRGNVAAALAEIAPGDERVVEALVRALEDDVAAGREYEPVAWLVDAIGKLGPGARAATPSLLAELEKGQVRSKAARVLGAIGPDAAGSLEVVAALASALRSGDENLVWHAADALIEFGAHAVPFLVETTEPRFPERARGAAVRVLGVIGSRAREAVPVLLAMLESCDLKDTVIVALGEIGPAAGAAMMALLDLYETEEHWTWCLYHAPAKFGPALLPGLTRMLAARDGDLRLRALRTIAQLGPSAGDAMPSLEALSEDENPEVAEAALNAVLAVHGSSSTSEELLRPRLSGSELKAAFESSTSVFDPAPISEVEAMELLPMVLEKLRSRKESDPRKVLGVLKNLGPGATEILPQLIECHDNMRKNDLGGFKHRPLLETIIRVGGRSERLVPLLENALVSRDLVVVLRACRALWQRGRVTDQRLVWTAGKMFRQHVTYSSGSFGDGLDYMPENRIEAAEALAEMGSRGHAGIPALERALWDLEPRLRAFAALALWRVGGQARLPRVMDALLSAAAGRRSPIFLLGGADSARPVVSQALGEIGPAALPHIIPRLDDPDEQVRMALVEGLGRMGPRAAPARSALNARLADEDFRVCALAREALGRIGE